MDSECHLNTHSHGHVPVNGHCHGHVPAHCHSYISRPQVPAYQHTVVTLTVVFRVAVIVTSTVGHDGHITIIYTVTGHI